MSDLLDRPWRKFKTDPDPWAESVYESLKEEICTHEHLEAAKLEYFNVLLIGQISAGKSSFYNTIESVFSEYVTTRADAGTVDASLTTKFRTYQVKAVDNGNKPIRFRFCDTMGLSTESGLSPEDCGKIMDGHVRDGDDLREKLDSTSRAYKDDKMHCVVFLVDASRVSFMDDGMIEKFANIREQATNKFLNPVVILTKIDECCPELERDEGDITKVFHSRKMKELVVEVSQKFGVAQNMVFPVQNYSSETDKDQGIDILLLRALRQILRFSKTAIDDMHLREREQLKQEERREEERQEQREIARQEELKVAVANVRRLTLSPDQTSSKKKQAPSRPKQTPRPPVCTAIYDRRHEDDDELDMFSGEKFEVMNPNAGGGWALVKNSSGATGLVPADYIKM